MSQKKLKQLRKKLKVKYKDEKVFNYIYREAKRVMNDKKAS